MSDIDKRRGGFYWFDGKPYLSVTNILKVIDKPALRYWFGKQVYLAMVANPTLDQQAALAAPYAVSDTAKARGTTVHSIVEAWKQIGMFEVAPEFVGYKNAFAKWLGDTQAEIQTQEKTVVSEVHRYAGTLDMLVTINGRKVIVDVKTGKDIYPEAFLQLSAYKEALNIDADIAVLLLGETGKYKFEYGEYDIESFLAAKKLYENINKEDLKKVGYL